MRVPKRKQRALMLRLFKWTTPKDWYYDGHVWKMTPEAAAQALKKREAAKARYERIFKKEMSIAESLSRRNPRSFIEDVLEEERKPKRYTILSDGQRFELYSRKVNSQELKPGWFFLAKGVSEEQANAVIPRYAAKMEALHTPRRNPLWAAAERSKGFTLVTDGKRYGAVHPGELLPPGYSEWYVVRRNLSSLEEAQREAASQERALEMLNEKRSNPKRPTRADKIVKRIFAEILAEERQAKGGWYGKKYRGVGLVKSRHGHWVAIRRRRNPVPASAPSRALLCIGQLRDLELYDPHTNRTAHIKPKGKWLAWDGKQFQICNVRGQVNATLPSSVVAKHRKFHAANPQGKPFLASMPDRGPTVRDVGLLKSLVYYVPSKIRSPGKNKYLWHHAFGDTGHKGGDSYPIKVMPMLQRDSAGNLFIKRRAGNIFRVDNWLRG